MRTWLKVLLAIAPSMALPARAEPVVDDVVPRQGYGDETNLLTVVGTGLAGDSRVSLLGGGPELRKVVFEGQGHTNVAVSDAYAVYGHWNGPLRLLDARDPARLMPLDEYPVEDLRGVALSGRTVYGLTIHSLVILEITDSGELVLVNDSFGDLSPHLDFGSLHMPVANGLLLVGARSGLHLVDVRDPFHPVRVGWWYQRNVTDVAVSGGFAYVTIADYDGDLPQRALAVIDIHDPGQPHQVAIVDLVSYGWPDAVSVDDGVAYVSVDGNVEVFDVSNHSSPQWLTRYDGVPGQPGDSYLTGSQVRSGFLYAVAIVLDGVSRMHVLDVRDPLAPQAVVAMPFRDLGLGLSTKVRLASGHAFVSNYRAGYLFDFHALAGPDPGPRIPVPASRIQIVGTRAFVGSSTAIRILDLEGPEAWVLRGEYDAAGWLPFVVDEGRLYVARQALCATGAGVCGYVDVVDVSDPESPARTGSAVIGGPNVTIQQIWDLAVQGATVLVSATGRRFDLLDWEGLFLVDASDPFDPAHAGFRPGWKCYRLATAGNHLYGTTETGMTVFDVSVPTSPTLLGALGGVEWPADLVATSQWVYLASGHGFRIVDVRSPSTPSVVGAVERPLESAGAISAQEHRVIWTSRYGRLHVYDVADPARPILEGEYDGVGTGKPVLFADRAYVPGGDAIQVVHFPPARPQVTAASDQVLEVAIPPGFAPGPYDVQVTDPDGATDTLYNSFLLCERREIAAELVPAGPLSSRDGWRVKCSGDERFFSPEPSHEAVLELPALPDTLEVRFVPGDGTTIEIEMRLDAGGGSGRVELRGAAEETMVALWDRARERGGFDLPRLDAEQYGDFQLRVDPRRPARLPRGLTTRRRSAAFRPTEMTMSRDLGRVAAPTGDRRYVFVVDAAGELRAARTEGGGTDLSVRVTGTYEFGCRAAATARATAE